MNKTYDFLMLFPGELEDLPPALHSALQLRKKGYSVSALFMSASTLNTERLEKAGIQIHTLLNGKYGDTSKAFRLLLKVIYFFRTMIILRQTQPVAIWLHSAPAMLYFLWCPFIRPIVVCHCHELYDRHPFLRYIQLRMVRKANIFITPDPIRSWILKSQSGTKAPFVTLQNYFPEDHDQTEVNEKYALEVFRNKGGSPHCRKIFIYQGYIHPQRCLKELIYSFRRLTEEEWGLLLLGKEQKNSYLMELIEAAEEDPRIVFHEKVAYPEHLKITSGCHAGIMLYAPISLNNIFCAPNKIFEYAASGVGVIAPSYPTLDWIADKFDFVETCDLFDQDSIELAIIKLGQRDKSEFKRETEAFIAGLEEPGRVIDKLMDILKMNGSTRL